MEESKEIKLSNKTFAMLFGVFNIYSVFLMIRIHNSIPKQKELLDNLLSGAPLPAVTEFFISNYIYFWSLPLLTFILLVITAMREKASKALLGACIIATFSTIFILQNLTYEALLAPLVELMDKL